MPDGKLVAGKQQPKGKLRKFVDDITTPIVDLPDVGGPLGDLQRAAEGMTAPAGLAAIAFAPVGAAGRLTAGVLGREAAVGIAGNLAATKASDVAEGYTGPAAGLVQVAAPLTTAVVAGRYTARSLGAKPTVSRIKELDAQDLTTDPKTLTAPIDKISYLIRNAKQNYVDNELLRKPERSRRAGSLASHLESGDYSVDAFKTAPRTLQGELPRQRFQPPAEMLNNGVFLTPQDLDNTLLMIKDANLRPYDRLNVGSAMIKVFENGQMPTRAEAKLLAQVYGEDFVASIMKHQTKPEVWKELAYDLIGLPRAIKASMDVSAPLRQGALMAGRPTAFLGALKPMFQSFGSESKATAYLQAIQDDVYYKQAIDAGLDITSLSKRTMAGNSEEYFGKIPTVLQNTALSAGIRASERAYTVFLDKLRFDSFKSVAREWESAGKNDAENLRRVAAFFNYATGRGELPKDVAKYSEFLSAAMFAPKFTYSRFAAPGMLVKSTIAAARKDPSLLLNPAALYGSDPVLKEMARNLGSFMALGVGALSVAKLTGAFDVELDPRSSEFGKPRIGNTRVDFWAGYQPLVRYVAQAVAGERKGGTGQVVDADRKQTIARLLRSKESPVAGLLHDVLSGTTFLGDEVRADDVSFAKQLAGAVTPLFFADVLASVDEYGAKGALFTAPAALGVGIQTYSSLRDKQNEVATEMFGKPYKELLPQQADAVNADQRVVLKEQASEGRVNNYGDAVKKADQDKLDAENVAYASLKNGGSLKDFADDLANTQLRTKTRKDQAALDFDVSFLPPNSPLQKALSGYYDLYKQSDDGYDPVRPDASIITGNINWERFDELERAYLARLSPEERVFVEGRRKAEHATNVDWFYDAKDYINKSGYYETIDKSFKRYASRAKLIVPGATSVSDLEEVQNLALQTGDKRTYTKVTKLLNKIHSDASEAKLKLRKRNAKLEESLIKTGRVTVPVNRQNKNKVIVP